MQASELMSLEDLEIHHSRSDRKHVLSISVENRPGVLARVAGLFSRRGFNIDTLAVGPTSDPDISRITLTLDGAIHPMDQVTKQLHKLINVIKIRDLDPKNAVTRELALIKVHADATTRGQVIQLVEIFRGEVVDVTADSVTIQVAGGPEELINIEKLLEPFGVIELVKTGVVALSRGSSAT